MNCCPRPVSLLPTATTACSTSVTSGRGRARSRANVDEMPPAPRILRGARASATGVTRTSTQPLTPTSRCTELRSSLCFACGDCTHSSQSMISRRFLLLGHHSPPPHSGPDRDAADQCPPPERSRRVVVRCQWHGWHGSVIELNRPSSGARWPSATRMEWAECGSCRPLCWACSVTCRDGAIRWNRAKGDGETPHYLSSFIRQWILWNGTKADQVCTTADHDGAGRIVPGWGRISCTSSTQWHVWHSSSLPSRACSRLQRCTAQLLGQPRRHQARPQQWPPRRHSVG